MFRLYFMFVLQLGGTGSVGLMAIQLLQSWGWEVIVTGTNKSKQALSALETKRQQLSTENKNQSTSIAVQQYYKSIKP
jgi:NADPH:quinone reductase-like Zn-dependent oxidoreductase